MLHYLPRLRELVFRTPHWRTDGTGMILLQHDFLTLLARGPQFTLEFALDINKDYDAIATTLTSHYQRDLEPLLKITPCYVQSISSLLAAPLELAIQAPGAAHPELSSLGVIDSRLPTVHAGPAITVEIEDWWLGVQIINRVLQTYLWMREGELHLACHYNDAFYEREFVEGFLEEWKAKLVGELIA
ncbi:hypothetical protein N7445_008683 [Penicillium cf. griseofulvum]|nr:hypothetical protein N7445_008683 [Penicillium cf. griseofulvum]